MDSPLGTEGFPIPPDPMHHLVEPLLVTDVLQERISVGKDGIVDPATVDAVLEPPAGLCLLS